MYKFFMWLDSIYQGLTNPLPVLLMFLGFIAAGTILGFLIAAVIWKFLFDENFFSRYF